MVISISYQTSHRRTVHGGRETMYTKLIEVLVPYRMCEKCKHFDLTWTTLNADGEPYHIAYRCANEGFCEHIIHNIDLASAEQ